METAYLAALLTVQGIGQERVRALVRYFGSARAGWLADSSALSACGCLPAAVVDSLLEVRRRLAPADLLSGWRQQGIFVVARRDAAYPAGLKTIYHPPELLFYRGSLPEHDRLLAIVGTRRASAYGKNAARQLAAALASAGFWVVSGAASGIDTAAHHGALETGRTIAVLGCGVDVSYPRQNARLLEAIAATGAVVSEYPPGTQPLPGLFPARNRIISGLARGVVIVEAAEKSGALITADAALEQNRDVFAVPGSIFSPQSRGAHLLIKQGAKLVDCAADILEEYQIEYCVNKALPQFSPAQTAVHNALSAELPLSVEEIVMRTNLAVADVSYILLQFELQGLVRAEGQRYVRSAWEGIY
ncbi:MAG: DNA-processing protein DprA [Sporomusaceae bacterium]|nr:DNA-processing protein DprA [Sporomusaceae bacterium]